MKLRFIFAAGTAAAFLVACEQQGPAEPMEAAQSEPPPAPAPGAEADLSSEKSQFSYTVGFQLGQRVGLDGLQADSAALARGLRDALEGKEPAISAQQMQTALSSYRQKLVAERAEAAEANASEGDAFLAENEGKEGVVVLPSGLQYKIIEEGEGASPGPESTVLVHYRGTLLDGEEFDSSYGRGEPTKLQVSNVIQGWQEALQLMEEGAKWKLYVPADLGYGARGAGDAIGPNETLLFDVELLEVQDEKPAQD